MILRTYSSSEEIVRLIAYLNENISGGVNAEFNVFEILYTWGCRVEPLKRDTVLSFNVEDLRKVQDDFEKFDKNIFYNASFQ